MKNPLEAAAVFLRQQFAGVARAHGGDKVGEHDAALQEADAAMKLKLPTIKKRFRQAGQFKLIGGKAALISGVVDGENLADRRVRDQRHDEAALPVVRVDDLRAPGQMSDAL